MTISGSINRWAGAVGLGHRLDPDAFGGPDTVYLSPHSDDICFSLGALLARRPGGRMITLFSRSAYVRDARHVGLNADAITGLRRSEDAAYAASAGLERYELDLAEPPMNGRASRDLAGVDADAAALAPVLLPLLEKMAVPGRRPALFCPAGIGNHVNHVATLQVIRGAAPALTRHFRVLFYEDLHYAHRFGARQHGLQRLHAAFAGACLSRYRLTLSQEEGSAKLRSFALYRSQFDALPSDLGHYTPWPAWPSGPQEAAWLLEE